MRRSGNNGVEELKRKCDMCQIETGVDFTYVLDYGPWQEKSNLIVHYYCLLLSTDLMQNGADNAGILGFEMRDIRKCIKAAAKVVCCYCNNTNATIRCKQCSVYFHMVCGVKRGCLFQFFDNFNSYCADCYPLNEFQLKVKKENKIMQCYICKGFIQMYNPKSWIYGPCCHNGFVHIMCMRRYAHSAGYYLKCIWCKSTAFREMVKQMGVFVPDREANWENNQAYQDLHKGHNQCDIEKCLCPRGRDYTSAKWEIILCECCGGFGAHNPICINGLRSKEKVERYKCSTCIVIESQARVEPYTDSSIEIISFHSDSSTDTTYPTNTNTIHNEPADPTVSIKTAHNGITDNEQVSCFSRSSIDTVVSNASISKQTHSAETTNNAKFVTLQCVTLDEKDEPSGIALARINLNSPRFKGMTVEEISENSMKLLRPNDLTYATDNIDVPHTIRRVIQQVAKKKY